MRTTVLRIIALCLLLVPGLVHGQSKVAVPGTTGIYMVSDDYKLWGLEVEGKLVVEKKYVGFKSDDGKFFVVTALGGKKGVCDATGTFIYPCEYAQASVTKGTIMVKATEDAKPVFTSTASPKEEKKAKEVTIMDIEAEIEKNSPPGTYINLKNVKHKETMAAAAAISLKAPLAAHNFRVDKFGKLELLVNGKPYFTAQEFNLLYEEPGTYESKESGNTGVTLYYSVFNSFGGGMSGTYGVIALDIYLDKATGKTMVGCIQTIPYRPTEHSWYSYIEVYKGSILKCTTNSGAPKYFTNLGRPVTWPDGIYSGKPAVFGELPEAVKNFKDYKVR